MKFKQLYLTEVKKYNYKPSDFTVKKIGGKISHEFESKDGEVLANLFWEKGNVEVRGMVGEYGTLEMKLPMMYQSSEPTKSDLDKVLVSIIRNLNRGVYHE